MTQYLLILSITIQHKVSQEVWYTYIGARWFLLLLSEGWVRLNVRVCECPTGFWAWPRFADLEPWCTPGCSEHLRF